MRHDAVLLLLLLILLSTMLLSKLFPVGAMSVCFWAEAFSIITKHVACLWNGEASGAEEVLVLA
jgi:hypothetical protein